MTTAQLKKFIKKNGTGVSLLDGAIQLPHDAIVDIIEHYEELASNQTKEADNA